MSPCTYSRLLLEIQLQTGQFYRPAQYNIQLEKINRTIRLAISSRFGYFLRLRRNRVTFKKSSKALIARRSGQAIQLQPRVATLQAASLPTRDVSTEHYIIILLWKQNPRDKYGQNVRDLCLLAGLHRNSNTTRNRIYFHFVGFIYYFEELIMIYAFVRVQHKAYNNRPVENRSGSRHLQTSICKLYCYNVKKYILNVILPY